VQNTAGWRGVIDRYRDQLPVSDATPVVTLLEGNTPLVRVPDFVKAIGGEFDLYLKYEGVNPTCSFKDRGMTMAVSKAKERGAQVVVCASTGNTSAAAAAYAARAGMQCVVLIPEGNIALGKLAQSLMYGAQTLQIQGNFDQALDIVRGLGESKGVEVVNSINPVRIEGQKTAAFEVCDALGDAPDFHFLPVGNAGNITAYWKGYQQYEEAAKSDTLPRMMGFQAAGAAPLWMVNRWPIQRRLPVLFVSVIPPVGREPKRQSNSQVAKLIRLLMSKLFLHTNSSPPVREFLWSRLVPLHLQELSRFPRRVGLMKGVSSLLR